MAGERGGGTGTGARGEKAERTGAGVTGGDAQLGGTSGAVGRACGKVILLGEHFVVHGIPAIAVGISNYCEVNLTESPEITFNGPKGTSRELSTGAISNILNSMGIKKKYAIGYGGNLPIWGGLGSSAAFCVAIVRALATEHGLKLTNEQVNRHAYEGERSFHGNPSGIDNTVSAHGGAILFTRGKTPAENRFEPLKIGCEFHLVVGTTGIYGPTAAMVAKVGEFKRREPAVFEKLAGAARDVVSEGVKSLKECNAVRLGELMNINQGLLSSLGVSIEENDRLVDAMRKAGALGAKLTGGGGGGVCIALANDEDHAKEILREIQKEGFDGFITSVCR